MPQPALDNPGRTWYHKEQKGGGGLKRNAMVLGIAIALVALVAVAGALLSGADDPLRSDDPADPSVPADAIAYLRVQVDDTVWPLTPLSEAGQWTIEQDNGAKNVLRATERGVVMHFSTCDNQNCVHQGEVSLDNRDSRALGNMIVCLPNKVIVELLTPEEAGVGGGEELP